MSARMYFTAFIISHFNSSQPTEIHYDRCRLKPQMLYSRLRIYFGGTENLRHFEVQQCIDCLWSQLPLYRDQRSPSRISFRIPCFSPYITDYTACTKRETQTVSASIRSYRCFAISPPTPEHQYLS